MDKKPVDKAAMLTKGDILSGLQRLGIQPGCRLGVHASLSSFGHVEGGANTVIEALMEAVGPEGTLVMSTYRLSPPLPLSKTDHALGITWKVRRLALDDRVTRSGMGVISDTFRQRSDVAHWEHPYHALAAWGKDAEFYCRSFKPLVAAGGSILLLGVEMDRCSALHIAEEGPLLPEDVRRWMSWEIPEEVFELYPPENWLVGCQGSWGDYLLVQKEGEARGLVKRTLIGQSQARLFIARLILNLYEDLLRENPHRMFGVPGQPSTNS